MTVMAWILNTCLGWQADSECPNHVSGAPTPGLDAVLQSALEQAVHIIVALAAIVLRRWLRKPKLALMRPGTFVGVIRGSCGHQAPHSTDDAFPTGFLEARKAAMIQASSCRTGRKCCGGAVALAIAMMFP